MFNTKNMNVKTIQAIKTERVNIKGATCFIKSKIQVKTIKLIKALNKFCHYVFEINLCE